MPTLSRATLTHDGPLRLAVIGAVSALVGLAASYPTDDGLAVAILVLAAGIVLVCLPVRLPGSLLALLPAVLIPSWLALGLLATAALAAAATLAGGLIRGYRPISAWLAALMAVVGVVGGDLIARLLAAGGLLSIPLPERVALAASFAVGSWAAERLVIWCATPAGLAGDLRGLPRMSVVANLLLAWPAAILADVLMARGLLLFGLLLAVLVAALVLIALYLGAETARWGAAGERERLQSIVSQVPDGIFTVRPDLTIDWLNETAAGLTGWEPDDAAGRDSADVVQAHNSEGVPLDHRRAFLEAARSGQPVHTRATLRSRDGDEKTVIVSYTSMASPEDELKFGIAAVREVPQAAHDTHESQISALGHELRSPLTAILGYAQLMQRETPGSADAAVRQAEYVERIAASGDYMLRLVNNLLDLRRMESGVEEVQPTPLNLERVLQVVVGLARVNATEKRIEMILSVEPNMPPFTTDELLLRRMVDNLVSNAIKYTLPGGTVHIKVTRRGEGIEIAVIDTGIGIDEEEREHLFERFFRSARPEARQERGTGLGLALVQESVRRLGGEISVTSTVDVGSTFTVWLPSLAPVESVPVIPPAGSTSASDA